MESKNEGGYNKTFWIIGGGLLVGLVGSAYYLYSTLFSQDDELTEEQVLQLNEIKEDINNLQEEGLTVEKAVHIMAMSNRIAEEKLLKNKPDLDERRRAAIENQEEYEIICQEVLQEKEIAYNEAFEQIQRHFGKISMEEIHKAMSSVTPQELEKINHKYDVQKFEEMPVPDEKLVKAAFIFYGRKFKEEMTEFQKTMSKPSSMFDPQQEQLIFFRILIIKSKVDDYLYLRYKYTEPQIKYMLHEYNLLNDPEVKKVLNHLSQIDSMMMGA